MEHVKACDSAGSVFDFVSGAFGLEAGHQGGQKIEPFLWRDFETLRMARVSAHEDADAKLGARCNAMEHAKACDSAGSVFDFVSGASGLEAGHHSGQKREPFWRWDFETLRMARVSAHEGADAKLGARCVAMEHAKAQYSARSDFDFVSGVIGLEAGHYGGQKIGPF